ncbi:putative alpha-1,6-mannosyltransferase mnn11 [Lithohypha guttulata]|nr:putative alpha-1,6-mannosyltransferase mnn11 [Lithohypha guttulata]
MHFALPPRKTSFPPPYARVSAKNYSEKRRRQIQYLAYLIFAVLTLYLVAAFFTGEYVRSQDGTISPGASVVIVTVLDEVSMSKDYISVIKENRDDYARRHGYQTFYTNTTTYAHLTKPSPTSWSMVPALRHALTAYSDVDYVWYLSPHALMMNPSISLYDHVFANLTNLMQKDIPVVPPDSVIHTFSHLKPSQIYLILSQDADNVAHTSFILRNSDTVPVAAGTPRDSWSQYFLDAWFDPLYRAYAFQKAENHALEHIIQWHPTILAKLAMVDQRLINSYNTMSDKTEVDLDTDVAHGKHDSQYRKGDLLVNFKGCSESKQRDCEKEIKTFYRRWQDEVGRIDGRSGTGKTQAA